MGRITVNQQKRNGNTLIMSACVPEVIYETGLRVAELHGYESMSSFVKDAIIEKIEATASAMSNICRKQKSTYKEFGPQTDF